MVWMLMSRCVCCDPAVNTQLHLVFESGTYAITVLHVDVIDFSLQAPKFYVS